MKKKILVILAVICVIASGAGYYFYRTQRNVSVGLNKSIQDETGKKGNTFLDSSKVLVVYFSNGGNTQKLAKEIYDQVGGDFRQIKPVKAYPKGNKLYDYTKNEQEKDKRPKLKDLNIDMSQYDTIFIGYPIWWGIAAWPVDTFVKANDFSNKTVIPFCTSASSGLGESGTKLQKESKGGNWQKGQRFSSSPSDSTIKDWTDSLK